MEQQTQGLIIRKDWDTRIVVVYDDIASFLVTQTIIHEIGHLQFMDMGLSRNDEEAHVRKNIDTGFLRRLLGQEWVEATVAALETKVLTIEKKGQFYQAYTPQAIETFYQQLRKAGINIERNPLHDGIIGKMVFILTNSEQKLSVACEPPRHTRTPEKSERLRSCAAGYSLTILRAAAGTHDR